MTDTPSTGSDQQRRRWLLALVLGALGGVILIVAVAWWSGFGVSKLRAFDAEQDGKTERAVFFTGEKLRLPDNLAGPGPIRFVHFWDPDCPCHLETNAHLNYLIGLYKYNKEVVFYSVRKPGTTGELEALLKGKLNELPGIPGMETLPASPAVAIFDRDGKLAYAGPYSEGLVCNSANSFVEPVLNALTDGKPVVAPNSMAVGCYCDWSAKAN